MGVLGQPAPTVGQTRSPHARERARRQVASLRGPREQLPQQLRCFTRVRSAFQQLGGPGDPVSSPRGLQRLDKSLAQSGAQGMFGEPPAPALEVTLAAGPVTSVP